MARYPFFVYSVCVRCTDFIFHVYIIHLFFVIVNMIDEKTLKFIFFDK